MRNDQSLPRSKQYAQEIATLQVKQEEAEQEEQRHEYALIEKYTHEVFNFRTMQKLLQWMIGNSIENMTFYTSRTATTSLRVMINSTLGYSLIHKCNENRKYNGYYYVQYGGTYWALSEVKTPDDDGTFLSIIEINFESM